MGNFRLLHATDFHICIEPNRKNRISLWREGKQDSLEGFGKTDFRTARLRPGSGIQAANILGGTFPQRFFDDFYFSSYRPEVSEQFARFVHFNKDAIDLIVLSGDLATTGLASDIKSAFDYFVINPNWRFGYSQSHYRPPIDDSIPTVVIPGNHDRYRDSVGRAGGNNFDLKFDGLWPIGRLKSKRVSYNAVGAEEQIIVIGADFTFKLNSDAIGQRGNRTARILGRGICHDDVLKDLISITTTLKSENPNAAIVWATHFPVGMVEDDALALVNWEYVRDAAIANGIQVILAGHIHEKKRIDHSGCVVFVSGSCCAVDFIDNHCFSLLEFETEREIIKTVKNRNFRFQLDTFREDITDVTNL